MATDFAIPAEYEALLLPAVNLSIYHLFNFPTPPFATTTQLLSPTPDVAFFKDSATRVESTTIQALRLIVNVPSAEDLQTLLPLATSAVSSGLDSFRWEFRPKTTISVPIWTLRYWQMMHNVRDVCALWRPAQSFIISCSAVSVDALTSSDLDAAQVLSRIPWFIQQPSRYFGFSGPHKILNGILRQSWLSDEHALQFLQMLEPKINDDIDKYTVDYAMLNPYALLKLIDVYQNTTQREQYPNIPNSQALTGIGESILRLSVTRIGMLVPVCIQANSAPSLATGNGSIKSNHWTSLVIDLQEGEYKYGDPMGHDMPLLLKEIFDWWLPKYGPHGGCSTVQLATVAQKDNYNCLVLSFLALAQEFTPAETSQPTSGDSLAIDRTRIVLANKLVELWLNEVSARYFLTSGK
jgi:hypothetical protein